VTIRQTRLMNDDEICVMAIPPELIVDPGPPISSR
jgi:hypothetical protein